MTISKHRLLERIGRVSAADMDRVDEALKRALSLP